MGKGMVEGQSGKEAHFLWPVLVAQQPGLSPVFPSILPLQIASSKQRILVIQHILCEYVNEVGTGEAFETGWMSLLNQWEMEITRVSSGSTAS